MYQGQPQQQQQQQQQQQPMYQGQPQQQQQQQQQQPYQQQPQQVVIQQQPQMEIKQIVVVQQQQQQPSNMPNPRSSVRVIPLSDGIDSDDVLLNNSEEIKRYFYTYNTRPDVYIRAIGTHMETRVREVRNPNGGFRTETYSESVVDFRFDLPLTQYFPNEGSIDANALKFCIDAYLASQNTLKHITLNKTLRFPDFPRVRQIILDKIRNRGYPHLISVDLINEKPKVRVQCSSDCSKCLRNPITTCLCWLTCTCICYNCYKMCFEPVFKFDSFFDFLVDSNQYIASLDQVIPYGSIPVNFSSGITVQLGPIGIRL